MRLTRINDTFVAEHSADGATWVSITDGVSASSVDVVMVDSIYIGLAPSVIQAHGGHPYRHECAWRQGA